MITQGPKEPRLRYLLRVAIKHILTHAPDLTTAYDETKCDGYCLADELKVEMECLPEIEQPLESVPPPDSRFDFRPHGWHWWYGQSGGLNVTTNQPEVAQWHVVHCWIAEGSNIPFAHSAHFRGPKQQKLMGGTWGPQVIPPSRP